MSSAKSPAFAARRAERQRRDKRANRIAVWTISIVLALGFIGIVILVVLNHTAADDQ